LPPAVTDAKVVFYSFHNYCDNLIRLFRNVGAGLTCKPGRWGHYQIAVLPEHMNLNCPLDLELLRMNLENVGASDLKVGLVPDFHVNIVVMGYPQRLHD
jgi:hypothetical protein